jgi:pyochelin biosynthesis protein PchC
MTGTGQVAVDTDSDTWLRRLTPTTTTPGTRLVCFPHAGGAATWFASFARTLAPAVEVIGVQYPGRQDRRREPFLDVPALADRVAAALADRPGPAVLFGHSLGAVVAYEVARRHPVEHLVVSGRRAPSVSRPDAVHRLSDEGLVAELRKVGGTSAAFLDDAEILAMILPATRADYRAVETYVPQPGPPLDVPVTALVGDADPYTSVPDVAAWAAATTGPFTLRQFAGGHFFLDDHRAAICAELATLVGGGDAR